jgi:hypothetical protein
MRIIATILVGFTLLAWSAATLYVDTHAIAYRAIAERLEASSRAEAEPDASYLARVEEALADDEILPYCSREVARSAASIRLALLDVAYRTSDATQKDAALSKARDTLLSGLRCYPRDGNFWLRLAMVEFARGGATSTVQDMLKASSAMAPSEAWIIVPRISFAARLSAAELSGVEEVLRADVHNLAGYGRIPDIVELYVSGSEPLRAVFESAFDTVSAERLAAIERGVAAKAAEPSTAK